MKRLPNHNYIFEREYPIQSLSEYGSHKRLRVFIHKGNVCETCGIVCDRLIAGREPSSGHVHLDLYDSELKIMLTRGHIIPRSKGGKKTLCNLRPLCHVCNHKESDSLSTVCKIPEIVSNNILGKTVRRISRNPFQNGQETVKILKVYHHEIENRPYFSFGEDLTYPLDKVFFI